MKFPFTTHALPLLVSAALFSCAADAGGHTPTADDEKQNSWTLSQDLNYVYLAQDWRDLPFEQRQQVYRMAMGQIAEAIEESKVDLPGSLTARLRNPLELSDIRDELERNLDRLDAWGLTVPENAWRAATMPSAFFAFGGFGASASVGAGGSVGFAKLILVVKGFTVRRISKADGEIDPDWWTPRLDVSFKMIPIKLGGGAGGGGGIGAHGGVGFVFGDLPRARDFRGRLGMVNLVPAEGGLGALFIAGLLWRGGSDGRPDNFFVGAGVEVGANLKAEAHVQAGAVVAAWPLLKHLAGFGNFEEGGGIDPLTGKPTNELNRGIIEYERGSGDETEKGLADTSTDSLVVFPDTPGPLPLSEEQARALEARWGHLVELPEASAR